MLQLEHRELGILVNCEKPGFRFRLQWLRRCDGLFCVDLVVL